MRRAFLLIGPLVIAGLLAFRQPAQRPACDPDNAGLVLPKGFCATLFASVPAARHLAVAPNGDVFVASQGGRGGGGGVYVLRDKDGDGHADSMVRFASGSATGIALTADAIYLAPNDRIIRYPWKPGAMLPSDTTGVVIIKNLPTGGHTAKTIALGKSGEIYVDHGSASNICQPGGTREPSPSTGACPELPTRAGIWRYDANKPGQVPTDGIRWVTGLRNGMAIAVEPTTGKLWGATHGRDNLTAWGFSPQDNAEKPAEEFGLLDKGADYGWPYCWYDPIAKRKVQGQEYGGDGVKQGECASKTQPVIGFPGHWAPLQLTFNTGRGFGAEYQGGAFLAFHGSWNRAPLPQDGHRIVYIPFKDGKATGTYTTFAKGVQDIKMSGVGMRPDGGAMFIAADVVGKIWRVVPTGN